MNKAEFFEKKGLTSYARMLREGKLPVIILDNSVTLEKVGKITLPKRKYKDGFRIRKRDEVVRFINSGKDMKGQIYFKDRHYVVVANADWGLKVKRGETKFTIPYEDFAMDRYEKKVARPWLGVFEMVEIICPDVEVDFFTDIPTGIDQIYLAELVEDFFELNVIREEDIINFKKVKDVYEYVKTKI